MTAPESRDAQSGVEAVLAGVLAEHDDPLGWTCDDNDASVYECNCGDRSPALETNHIHPKDCDDAAHWHRAHVAAMQAAALGPVIATARAEALREAAEQCDRDAEDGHCGSPVCAENNRITARWLRDRADREQAGHQDTQKAAVAPRRGEVAPAPTEDRSGAQSGDYEEER